MRMGMRRFSRLTNGVSKTIENQLHAVWLHFMRYNSGRVHKSLRVMLATMAAGVEDPVWTIEKIVSLVHLAGRQEVQALQGAPIALRGNSLVHIARESTRQQCCGKQRL